jgi:hypothetical protein
MSKNSTCPGMSAETGITFCQGSVTSVRRAAHFQPNDFRRKLARTVRTRFLGLA